MRSSRILIIVLALAAVAMVVNSCKKQSQSPIQQLFSGGYWELASITVTYYTGNTVDSTATDTVCQAGQKFTFYSNNTCNYTNFDCIPQTSNTASWTLTPNQLYLETNILCKDTTAKGSSMPFAYAQIENLGVYSLVLNIGDIQPNYSLTQRRVIYQYGFIRQQPTTGN